jgi:hypothetical protein
MTVTNNRGSATAASSTIPTQRSQSARHTGRRLALLVGGLTLLTTTAVIGWLSVSGSPEQQQPATVRSGIQNLPGGSVYDQQVPSFTDWSVEFGPGSAVYRQQVPAFTDWSGYGPGSQLYREQVPQFSN